MRTTKKSLILLLMCGLIITNGCSYMQLEDNIKSGLENIGKEEIGKEDNNPEKNPVAESGETEEREGDSFYYTGESIMWTDYFQQQIRYTLEGVETYSNLDDFGIAKEEFVPTAQSQISDQGELLDSYGREAILVAADIEIENINFQSYDNGKIEDNMFQIIVDSFGISEQELKSGAGGSEAAYFSLHSLEENDYYKFTLKQGEKTKVRLAWIISKELYQEPYYYMIGAGLGEETNPYFLLNRVKEYD